MAPHSSTLAWTIPWTEEPGRLQSMGSHRVGHDWATSLSLFTFMHWEGNGNPLQCSCLENPRDGGAWWAAVYGVTPSRTWLKRLSSSSSNQKHIMQTKNRVVGLVKSLWKNAVSNRPLNRIFWYKVIDVYLKILVMLFYWGKDNIHKDGRKPHIKPFQYQTNWAQEKGGGEWYYVQGKSAT